MTVGLPIGTSTPQPAGAPVENGDFEIGYTPEPVTQAVAGTPVDECVGIGHPAFFGPDSAPGALTGGKAGSPNADDADPQQAADNVTADPIWWVEYQSGYGHCVYDPQGQGVDIVWLQAKERSEQAALWSYHPRDASAEFGFNFDDDPFDREVRFPADDSLASHNLWQTYVSQPGAYTANFTEFRLTLEDGSVPSSARVILSLSATPLETQTPYLAGYLDCQLTFPSSVLSPDSDDVVRVDPLEGILQNDGSDSTPFCEEAVNTFNDPDASEDDKRDALGRLRIVQLSFWSFHTGAEDVVVDDIAIQDASLFVEEAARGNVLVDPDPGLEDV